VYETRHQFREDLKERERQTLEQIDLVVGQLDRALASLANHDLELARLVVAADERIDGRCLEIHQGVLLLLARQTPVAGDLRILAALLHVIRYVERIGAQCANIAKLVPLSGNQPPTDKPILEAIERMAQLARGQVTQAKEAFHSRDVRLAEDLVGKDAGIGRLSRELFYRSVEIGDDIDVREWAMFMVLVARCLERVGENAVAIAEQTVFVVSGLFREFAGPSQFT
jgi:phosphate transport system protein